MNTQVTFVDCPAYMDRHGTARCGLPVALEYRYTVSSADGPLQAARIRCLRGHWFNAPIQALTVQNCPSAAIPAPTPPAISRLGGRREGGTSANPARLP